MSVTQAKSRKTEVLAAILGANNVYDALVMLATDPTGKQNMVRVSDYQAEDKGGAGKRSHEEKSGRGKGQNVGSKIIGKHTGLAWSKKGNRSTMFIGYQDLTSSKSGKAGDYDFRSMIVVDILKPDQNVEAVEVCENFGSWQKVRPVDFPTMWPVLPADMQESFLMTLVECQMIGATIELLNNKIAYIKKALKKNGTFYAVATGGLVYRFNAPVGMTERTYLADKTTPVKMVPREIDLIRLAIMVPAPLLGVLYPEWTEVATKGKAKGKSVLKSDSELLPLYAAELVRLKAEYTKVYETVRPYELGLIESALTEEGTLPEFIDVDGTALEIERNTDKRYEMPTDTKEKLESGEYVTLKVAKSKGTWELIPAKVAETV